MSDERIQDEPRESRLGRLVHRLAEEDPSTRLSLPARVLMTVAPIVGAALILLAATLVSGLGLAAFLLAMLLGSFMGGGKFVVFGSAVANAFTHTYLGYTIESVDVSAWVLAGLVVYGDTGTCLVMLANMTVLYRMPWVGRRLAMAHEAGWYMLQVHSWMRRMAWIGVALFVAVPFQGTGAVGGTIVARILGLSWWGTLTATVAGSVAGCSGMAVLGNIGRKHAEGIANHPAVSVAVVVGTLVTVILLGRWFLGQSEMAKEQYLAEQEAKPQE
jgi:hypothetical protein